MLARYCLERTLRELDRFESSVREENTFEKYNGLLLGIGSALPAAEEEGNNPRNRSGSNLAICGEGRTPNTNGNPRGRTPPLIFQSPPKISVGSIFFTVSHTSPGCWCLPSMSAPTPEEAPRAFSSFNTDRPLEQQLNRFQGVLTVSFSTQLRRSLLWERWGGKNIMDATRVLCVRVATFVLHMVIEAVG